tara:strand:- start:5277 stop:5921 length:645 start_codon:yes stop_codon:yes gene_type:complete
MKRLLVLVMVCLAVVCCKKDDDDNNGNNSSSSTFDKSCTIFGEEYWNSTANYTWDSGGGTVTTSEECAVYIYTSESDGSNVYEEEYQYDWGDFDLVFMLPEDSSTLSNLELNTSNQSFGFSNPIRPNDVNEYDNYFYIDQIEDNMGVRWETPSDLTISSPYFHRFTALNHQRDVNKIIWKIEGEFSTYVIKSDDNTQSREVSGNYIIYHETNRL